MALSKFSYLKSWIGKFRQCHGAYSMGSHSVFPYYRAMPLLQHCSIRVYFPNTPKQFMQFHSSRVIRELFHYTDVIMSAVASQIISLTIVYSTVYSGVDQRKHKSSASLTFMRGIHWSPMNSPHKWPVTRKMFLFDDVIIYLRECLETCPREEMKHISCIL